MTNLEGQRRQYDLVEVARQPVRAGLVRTQHRDSVRQ
jgi:hypothetical protein